MNRLSRYLGAALAVIVVLSEWIGSAYAQDPVIAEYTAEGQIIFPEIPDAMGYRVEWSSKIDGIWTNFAGTHGQWLDAIPAVGSGVITASVPMFYRVVATMPPSNMVYIPAGAFMMGNATNVLPAEEGGPDELPQHAVYTDAYFIDKYEMSEGRWWAMMLWSHQYVFSNGFPNGTSNLPKRDVTWYDAVLGCNLRSEYEGLTPVYYTDAAFSNVYRSDELVPYVNWAANGYRLPTEAEWEKAARGGVPDLRYPWNDTTNQYSSAKANCDSLFRIPVGSFPPNDYGLHDMAGNVWEWVWDWYDSTYYSASITNNPHGPAIGTYRIMRGGSCVHGPGAARIATRAWFWPSWEYPLYEDVGFRCVRRL